uniref:Pyrrolo-quinoline quinone repeat domain-containing protein n=1 Tax=Arcella intermedia TaxID=1963864 RepID=A0A6B2LEX6_9EUKA
MDPSSGNKIGNSVSLPGSLYMAVSQIRFNDRLLVGSYGSVYCYDTSNYNLLWTNELSGCGYHFGVSLSLLYEYGTALIVGFHGHVVSINPNSGKTNWTLSLPGSGYGFVSVVIRKNTIIAVSKGYLYAIDASGSILLKDGLSGLGYGDAIIGSKDGEDQNSSNLIFARLSAREHRSH